MIDKYQIGFKGENIASDYLISKGYKLIERNWRKSRYEIDIIASNADTILFVEVKSGRQTEYGSPMDKIDIRKRKRIAQAAEEYLATMDIYPENIRFDVIIVMNPNSDTPDISHIESAFTADFD